MPCYFNAGWVWVKKASDSQPFIPANGELISTSWPYFLAFFFLAMLSSFSSDIGESDICLEPIIEPNSLIARRETYALTWDHESFG
jgi:hypothetical protein